MNKKDYIVIDDTNQAEEHDGGDATTPEETTKETGTKTTEPIKEPESDDQGNDGETSVTGDATDAGDFADETGASGESDDGGSGSDDGKDDDVDGDAEDTIEDEGTTSNADETPAPMPSDDAPVTDEAQGDADDTPDMEETADEQATVTEDDKNDATVKDEAPVEEAPSKEQTVEEGTSATGSSSEKSVRGFVKVPIAVGIAVACAVGGLAVGHVTGNPMFGSTATQKKELTSAELNTVVGRVSFDGQTIDITAKDAIMLNDTLSGDKHEYPTADMVVSTARNMIMQRDAEKRGIKVTDESLAEFAKGMLGSDDYKTIASEYQIDEESLKALVKSSYVSQEIRKQVVSVEGEEPELAAPPATPAEGESDKATSEYYTYIIDSAGEEWDANKKAWVDETSEFAQALQSSKTFDPAAGTATYDDALAAYQVLGSRYSAKASTYDTLWNDYMKDLFSKANIMIYSLVA